MVENGPQIPNPESRVPVSESRIPSPDIAISVKNLTKIYKLYDSPQDRLKESLHPFRKKYHHDFYALNDISFEIKKGETVGIIGKNGSGKSTLLKLITGVLTPSSGSVTVNGKIAALLELGAGFNPELTGIENVYFNGTLMGYSKEEMDNMLEDILSFADIGDFANQQVKMYSSGMFARLAFSVSVNVDPEILIVDEALSVGDMHFQEKSITKMKKMVDNGKTILFVTHSLPVVRNFCRKGIWLDTGKVVINDDASYVCEKYRDKIMNEEIVIKEDNEEKSKKDNKIIITNVNTDRNNYFTDDDILLHMKLEFKQTVLQYGIGVIIYNSKHKIITLMSTVRDDVKLSGVDKITVRIPNNDFLKDTYHVSVSITDEMAMFAYDKEDYIVSFTVNDKTNKKGIPIAEGYFRSKHEWIF